jgi:hypothetical protein
VALAARFDDVNSPLSIDSSALTIPIKKPMTTTMTTTPIVVKIHRNRANEVEAPEAAAFADTPEPR